MIAAKDDTIRDVKIMSKSNPMYTFRKKRKNCGNISKLLLNSKQNLKLDFDEEWLQVVDGVGCYIRP